MVECGTFLVATSYLAEGMAVASAGEAIHTKKAAEVFPSGKETLRKAIKLGVKIACGSDAPAYRTESRPRTCGPLLTAG